MTSKENKKKGTLPASKRKQANPRKAHTLSGNKKKRKKKSGEKALPQWVTIGAKALACLAFVILIYNLLVKQGPSFYMPCQSEKIYGVCHPNHKGILGLDVSHHQGSIDWDMLVTHQDQRHPISFVFIKATEGVKFDDDAYDVNFAQAKQHNLIRGAYHFYNPKADPILQAQHFIDKVKLENGDLPPVVDVENKPRNAKKFRQDLRTWLKIVEMHYGVKPIIYASVKYKEKYLNDELLNDYPFWLAHYYVSQINSHGQPYLFWQYSNYGSLKGINEDVDLNLFNGTVQDLQTLCVK